MTILILAIGLDIPELRVERRRHGWPTAFICEDCIIEGDGYSPEPIRSSYHDGTFKNRAAAAKALAKTFRTKGERK